MDDGNIRYNIEKRSEKIGKENETQLPIETLKEEYRI